MLVSRRTRLRHDPRADEIVVASGQWCVCRAQGSEPLLAAVQSGQHPDSGIGDGHGMLPVGGP